MTVHERGRGQGWRARDPPTKLMSGLFPPWLLSSETVTGEEASKSSPPGTASNTTSRSITSRESITRCAYHRCSTHVVAAVAGTVLREGEWRGGVGA